LAKLLELNSTQESESLRSMYVETGGDNWINNSGWLVEPNHCKWFGVTCDDDGYVAEIMLGGNNVSGRFPANFISSLYNLSVLDLSNNQLTGLMIGSSMDDNGVVFNDASVFFDLRELVHIDVSQNQLSGEVDILFAPALEYVNFSHNKFDSIDSFKVS
jgi:Leucine-rich repeat (LRR) protein